MAVVIKGETQLHARLTALQDQGKPIMGMLGLAAVREQKLLVPRKTGNLGRTIHLGAVTDRSAITEATATYAAPVEFGTRAHIIRPRKGKALRFPGSGGGTLSGRVNSGGAVVFAKVVHHPGTKAQPFMRQGAINVIRKAGHLTAEILIRSWNRAA